MVETDALVVTEIEDAALAVILLRRGAWGAAGQALRRRCGLDLPPAGRLAAAGGLTLLWQGPDRYLAIHTGDGDGLMARVAPALEGLGHAVDASSSRGIFSIVGAGAQAMLDRLLPIDLHPRAFPPGSVASTVAEHIDVLVWRENDGFRLSCPRSFVGSLRACLGAS